MGVGLEFLRIPIHRPAPLFIAQKDVAQAADEFTGDLPQGHPLAGAGRAFDRKRIVVVGVHLSEWLDQQQVDWQPDRPTPVGVAAEQPGGRLGRLDKALDEAPMRRWVVVDMKKDWKAINPHTINEVRRILFLHQAPSPAERTRDLWGHWPRKGVRHSDYCLFTSL